MKYLYMNTKWLKCEKLTSEEKATWTFIITDGNAK
jgi:hypothetical protein